MDQSEVDETYYIFTLKEQSLIGVLQRAGTVLISKTHYKGPPPH